MPQFLKELKHKILSDLKHASQTPNVKNFLTVFIRFFVISSISFVGITLVILTLFIFVLAPFISNKVQKIKQYKGPFQMRGYSQNTDLTNLKKDVAQLKKLYFQLADKTFWENNKKEYTYEFPNYEVKLTNLGTYMGKWEMERKFVFGLSICPRDTDSPCFTNSKNDSDLIKFGFNSDEIINNLSVSAHVLTDIKGFVFAGNIETDKGVYPFVVYPKSTGSNEYEFVDNLPISGYTGVELDTQTENEILFIINANTMSSSGIRIKNFSKCFSLSEYYFES